MSKAVLISIRPEWCDLIKNGIKTLELRKSRPKLELPFKVYIYCTIGCSFLIGGKHPLSGNGKIIGEFVCNSIIKFIYERDGYGLEHEAAIIAKSCVPEKELYHYLQGKTPYGWNISALKIYDKPRELSEFKGLRKTKFGYEPIKIKKPPQSWRYVEEDI